MIHIGICDDIAEHREEIYQIISHLIFRYEDSQFYYFHSGDEVIQAIENKKFSCDLLLLDISMPGVSGLETAKYIREHQLDVDIIFITVSTEHIFDGYTYRAFSYILKPIDEQRLTNELERYIMEKKNLVGCLHVVVNGKKEKIILSQTLYFSGEGRKVIAHMQNKTLSFYGKLNEVEELVKSYGFLRCHQSFLVNMRYVSSYSRTELMIGEEIISISRKYIDDVRQCMDEGGLIHDK